MPADVDYVFTEVYVIGRQTAKLGDAQAGVEQNEYAVVVSAEMLVQLNEIEEASHVLAFESVAGFSSAVCFFVIAKLNGLAETQCAFNASANAGRSMPLRVCRDE